METLKRKIKTLFTEKNSVTRWFARQPFFKHIPDKPALKILYKNYFGKPLNLKNPQTFNEKLQWLKLYDRNPLYTTLVDKYAVKEYVAKIIGEEHIIPTLGVWDRFEDIDFDRLPDQFVLKCTHSSGDIVICKDKSKFDRKAAGEKLNYFLGKEFYSIAREWPYKNVKPRIIAEQYMEDETYHELRDYKFFVFGGTVRALFIASDRFNKEVDTKFDFFDADFNWLDLRKGHPNADVPPEKPKNFEQMKEFAARLGAGIPHVRVDFYEINGKVYFGEMTFYDWGGFQHFRPESWDRTFGDWIELPPKK